jgi:hypothetical protein
MTLPHEHSLSLVLVCTVLGRLSDKNIVPIEIRFHASDYEHVLKFDQSYFDVEKRKEFLISGTLGTLFGLPAKVSRISERAGVMRVMDETGLFHPFCTRCGKSVEDFCKTKSCIVQEVHDV